MHGVPLQTDARFMLALPVRSPATQNWRLRVPYSFPSAQACAKKRYDSLAET
jgi:hypothetical protein